MDVLAAGESGEEVAFTNARPPANRTRFREGLRDARLARVMSSGLFARGFAIQLRRSAGGVMTAVFVAEREKRCVKDGSDEARSRDPETRFDSPVPHLLVTR
jgi:hypothetical protein